MRPTRLLATSFGLLVGCLLVLGLAGGQDGAGNGKGRKEKTPKSERPERPEKGNKVEKAQRPDAEAVAVERAAERAAKPVMTERDRWLRELERAFPGRVSPGLSDADFEQWFGLVAGGGAEWRRDAPIKNNDDLFDRAAQRLNLTRPGALSRADFLAYARQFLTPANSPPWKAADPLPEAEKVFRSLDRDHSGFLESAEWPDRLRTVSAQVDANRDGRLDPAEYRAYFEGRVAAAVETGPDRKTPGAPGAKPPGQPGQPPAEAPVVAIRFGHLPTGLPGWFADLDTDRDAQVGLYEWRAAGRDIAGFLAMDLDGDGLLTPTEYLRFAKLPPPAEAAADAP